MIDPIPIRQRSSMVQLWRIAPWPGNPAPYSERNVFGNMDYAVILNIGIISDRYRADVSENGICPD